MLVTEMQHFFVTFAMCHSNNQQYFCEFLNNFKQNLQAGLQTQKLLIVLLNLKK